MSGLLRFKIIMTENGISPRLDDAGDWVRHSDIADMYEALKECLPLFDMVTALDDHGSNALGQAENLIRAALAKAEGRAND